MARWIIAIVLLLVAGHTAWAQSEAMRVGAASVQGPPGEEVLVPLTVKGANAVGAMHIELEFDPAVIEYKSVARGQMMSGNAMLDSSVSAGRLIIGLVSLDPVSGDGVAASARFVVRGEPGATSTLKLSNLRAWDNTNHADLLLLPEDGLFTTVAASATPALPLAGDKLPWLIAGGAVVVMFLVLVFRKSGKSAS